MSIPFGAHIPFVEHLGFSLETFEGGESELHFAPRPEHLNSFDVTHGGAVMTFLDVICWAITLATAITYCRSALPSATDGVPTQIKR